VNDNLADTCASRCGRIVHGNRCWYLVCTYFVMDVGIDVVLYLSIDYQMFHIIAWCASMLSHCCLFLDMHALCSSSSFFV
jgi:hypothetical protein